MVWRAFITMITSASGAILLRMTTIEILRSTFPKAKTTIVQKASLAVAWTPLSRTIMIIESSVTHALSFGSDASATDRTSASDAFLVPMTTTSLPAKIGTTSTMTTRIRCLSTCAQQPSSPFAWSEPTKELIHAVPTATSLRTGTTLPPSTLGTRYTNTSPMRLVSTKT